MSHMIQITDERETNRLNGEACSVASACAFSWPKESDGPPLSAAVEPALEWVKRRDVSCCPAGSDWVGEICRVLAQGRANTMQLASVLYRAKQTLRYGEWTRLWRSGRIPFSKRKGEMLAYIGNRLGTVDAQMSAHLPCGWNTLYCLAKLDPMLIEDLVRQGKIHGALTLQQARDLVARFTPATNTIHRRANVRLRLRRFQTFVRATAQEWSSADRHWAVIELRRLLTELEGHPVAGALQATRLFAPATPPPSNTSTHTLIL